MAYPSMREWVQKLDDLGLVQHITTEVDWDLELGAIARRVLYEGGPALLFENIKDHKDTPCNRLFINGMVFCRSDYDPAIIPIQPTMR